MPGVPLGHGGIPANWHPLHLTIKESVAAKNLWGGGSLLDAARLHRAHTDPSRPRNGKKAAGPVTIEKLADGLELVGDERSAFVQSGTAQSTRTAQAFGPNMARPFFRSVLCDLLRTLGIKGEVRGFQAEAGSTSTRYDLVVTMMDGAVLGVDFKTNKILVASADAKTGRLPSATEAAVLAAGGFIAKIKIHRTPSKS